MITSSWQHTDQIPAKVPPFVGALVQQKYVVVFAAYDQPNLIPYHPEVLQIIPILKSWEKLGLHGLFSKFYIFDSVTIHAYTCSFGIQTFMHV